jgi:hypothetical protein
MVLIYVRERKMIPLPVTNHRSLIFFDTKLIENAASGKIFRKKTGNCTELNVLVVVF